MTLTTKEIEQCCQLLDKDAETIRQMNESAVRLLAANAILQQRNPNFLPAISTAKILALFPDTSVSDPHDILTKSE